MKNLWNNSESLKYNKSDIASFDRRISVAPMMAYTDRHCRYFHRQKYRLLRRDQAKKAYPMPLTNQYRGFVDL